MRKILFSLFLIAILVSGFVINQGQERKREQIPILSYTVNPTEKQIQMFWKDTEGNILNNFTNLKTFVNKEDQELIFAMNGGMYLQDFSPQGIYIENGEVLKKLNQVEEAYGNFYLQPNGIFYITSNNEAVVVQRKDFTLNSTISYATQSGPMLLINGKIHSAFIEGSENLHYRNGVGILPNGDVLFALSKREINFYDFAKFFQDKGCKNALYLDGFVSRAYLPEQNWEQMDGNFGVMIGVVE